MLLKSRSYVCGDVTLGKPRDTQCSDVLATMTIDYVAATAAAQYGDVGDVWTNAVGASSFRAPIAAEKLAAHNEPHRACRYRCSE